MFFPFKDFRDVATSLSADEENGDSMHVLQSGLIGRERSRDISSNVTAS
jgi:hypothetical protein